MFQKQVKLYFGLQIVCVLSHFYSFYRFIYVSMQRFDAKQLVSRTRTVPQQTKFKQIYDFSTYFFRVGSRPNTRKTFQIENAPFNLLSRKQRSHTSNPHPSQSKIHPSNFLSRLAEMSNVQFQNDFLPLRSLLPLCTQPLPPKSPCLQLPLLEHFHPTPKEQGPPEVSQEGWHIEAGLGEWRNAIPTLLGVEGEKNLAQAERERSQRDGNVHVANFRNREGLDRTNCSIKDALAKVLVSRQG